MWETIKFGRKCKRCVVFPEELKEKNDRMRRIRRAVYLWIEKREEKECYQHIIELWHFCPSRPSLAAGGHINNISTPLTLLSHWLTHTHTYTLSHGPLLLCKIARGPGENWIHDESHWANERKAGRKKEGKTPWKRDAARESGKWLRNMEKRFSNEKFISLYVYG